MKSIRVLLALALFAALAMALAPVRAQEAPAFPVNLPDQIAEGRPVFIRVAAAIGDDQIEIRQQWDAQIARFQERYPNVTVDTFTYGFSADTFAALVAARQVPTLFEVPFTEPRALIAQGIPANLTGLFEQFGLTGLYNDSVLNIVQDEAGDIYGMPGFAYALGLAYSISALSAAGFDNPPATWEELGSMAAALTSDDGSMVGFAMNMQGGGGGWHFTNIAYGFGADIMARNEDGTYTATYGSGPAVDAMAFLQSIRPYMPVALDSNPTLELLQQSAAMAIQGGDSLGWLRLNAPDFDLNDLGFAAMPAGPDGTRRALSGGMARMINSAATADQQEAAFVYQLWKEFSPEELIPTREIFHNTQAGRGAPVLPLYAGEFQAAMDAIDAAYVTMPVANYRNFIDAVVSGELILVPEPPVAGQAYYSTVAEVLTTVLTDPNADVAALMAANAAAFQEANLNR
jgi:multiple sugar transport system substrate-binding protein